MVFGRLGCCGRGVDDGGAAGPAVDDGLGGGADLLGVAGRVGVEQVVVSAVVVVVNGVEVALRAVGKDRGDAGAARVGARGPPGDQRDRPHTPSAAGVVGRGQGARRPHRFGGGHPMHLGEGAVVDVARVDARPQSAHQP